MHWHEIHRIPEWLSLEGQLPIQAGPPTASCSGLCLHDFFLSPQTADHRAKTLHQLTCCCTSFRKIVLSLHRLILFLVPSCWLVKNCDCISGEQKLLRPNKSCWDMEFVSSSSVEHHWCFTDSGWLKEWTKQANFDLENTAEAKENKLGGAVLKAWI